ncbi:methyltransferase domain-containing protein [Echinimonas agarilytica]|uniref:tRNA 5-carboxymethoxyuridine methyltransferase n=1 Tax=Echinimonas agarilytica TaxID=1215918 RepID=A0AA41W7J3_9GAMM|nr:methyltransferase domain-containing protein [Echinimonas agarilytica]MCM2679978.1 methyltransferase domain-containing protein [Echinimonas agarilytica]
MNKKSNFDGAAGKFSRCIYDSAKGKVRLAVLQRDLQQVRDGRPLRVLDVGVGMGQMALWFAEAGHDVVACDISDDMLNETKVAAIARGCLQTMSFVYAGLDQLPELEKFDLVLCHAVLEWIEDHESFIQHLANQLKPQGHLSLMAFNQKALLYQHLVSANFEYVEGGMTRRSRQRLTPNWPITPAALENAIAKAGMSVSTRSGIRTFSDYVRDKQQTEIQQEALMRLELIHSQDPDFLAVSRYLHFYCLRG